MVEIVQAFDGRMPSTRGNGTPFSLFACHCTVGGTGLLGAEATIRFLLNTASQRNASYHEIWAWDAGKLYCYLLVPGHRAAHSVAPQPFSPGSGAPLYTPDTWVRNALGLNVGDPNQGIYSVSIAGGVGDCDSYARSRAFLEAADERFRQLRAQFDVDVRAEHFRFNPRTRSDWGRALTPALGGLTIPTKPPWSTPTMPKPPVTREERLAAEVVNLRKRFPKAAARWVGWTGITQAADGKPLRREVRLSAEATYLREVATDGKDVT